MPRESSGLGYNEKYDTNDSKNIREQQEEVLPIVVNPLKFPRKSSTSTDIFKNFAQLKKRQSLKSSYNPVKVYYSDDFFEQIDLHDTHIFKSKFRKQSLDDALEENKKIEEDGIKELFVNNQNIQNQQNLINKHKSLPPEMIHNTFVNKLSKINSKEDLLKADNKAPVSPQIRKRVRSIDSLDRQDYENIKKINIYY